jgi:hypothetical protein
MPAHQAVPQRSNSFPAGNKVPVLLRPTSVSPADHSPVPPEKNSPPRGNVAFLTPRFLLAGSPTFFACSSFGHQGRALGLGER